MTDFSKLGATSLPPKEAFYSQLSGSAISDKDYAHAQKVWIAFNCKTMRDYHDLHLKTDTLLLADVMTEFRMTCKKAYGLEALHYYTISRTRMGRDAKDNQGKARPNLRSGHVPNDRKRNQGWC